MIVSTGGRHALTSPCSFAHEGKTLLERQLVIRDQSWFWDNRGEFLTGDRRDPFEHVYGGRPRLSHDRLSVCSLQRSGRHGWLWD